MEPWVVIVCGPSGGGKSSLTGPLSQLLSLPVISKDDLKEVLFDSLGWGDRERSRALSEASYRLMFHLAERQLAAGRSCILEANFRPEAGAALRVLGARVPFRAIRVRCFADPEVLLERLKCRTQDRLRHPGHLDAELLPEAGTLIQEGSVEVEGPLIEVDTTDPQSVDVEEIARRLKGLME
jgi:predicted kinase